ncbi:MAG TPA: DUF1636 domain-containing protein [Rhodoblastus sp.]|nr:DUF1636 domain-containing protein [Rhodoblastus sp.]
MSDKTKIRICVKCRAAGEPKGPIEDRMGSHLYREMLAAAGTDEFVIEPVECFKVCVRPVTITVSAAGKWTYLFGDFPLGAAPEILDAARLYARMPDGIISKEEMPPALKLGQIARVPPG